MRKREEVFVLLNSSFLKKKKKGWNELYLFQFIKKRVDPLITVGKNLYCSLH